MASLVRPPLASTASSASVSQHLVVSGKCSCVLPSAVLCSRPFPDTSAACADGRRSSSIVLSSRSASSAHVSAANLRSKRQSFFGMALHVRSSVSTGGGSGAQRGVRGVEMSFSPHGMGANGQQFDDEEYLEAHVMDAVRMAPQQERLYMTMADGTEIEVEHVNPSAGRLLYPHSTPAIFVKVAGNSGLLLPIVVGDLAVGFLMKGFRKEPGARPCHYDVMRDIVESLNYEVRTVKITQRVMDTYLARIYLAHPDSPHCAASIDARPSDAINLAIRAQVPIFVSKSIVRSDAVRVVDEAHRIVSPGQPYSAAAHHVVRASPAATDSGGATDLLTEEMALTKSLMAAVQEERYGDAASLRDKLNQLRNRNPRQLNNRF
ncbi:hypothetical protein CLOM_g15358 [Closterium sp. NIES-68]|nr:hypothetical protein CLOM_g15358 [Closterium sp. NIES-68]GJP69976.1 hypothetical protein CLOP_g967 [Closterium sp. NIES-67]